MRNATTIPIAEQMFGFPTLEEAKEARRICLHEPIRRVEEFFDSLRPDVASGRIIHKRSANPDPPTSDATMWMRRPPRLTTGRSPGFASELGQSTRRRAAWFSGGPPFKH